MKKNPRKNTSMSDTTMPICIKRSLRDCVLIFAMEIHDAGNFLKMVKIEGIFQDANNLCSMSTQNFLNIFSQNIKFKVYGIALFQLMEIGKRMRVRNNGNAKSIFF